MSWCKSLQALKPTFVDEYSVSKLWLFGSRARGESCSDSDVDLLVQFDSRRLSLFDFLKLEELLENGLGMRVDLVDVEALREDFRAVVMREVVPV